MSTVVTQAAADAIAARWNRHGLVAYLLDPDGRTLAGPVTATAVCVGGESLGFDVRTDAPLTCNGPGLAWEVAIYSPRGRLVSYPINPPTEAQDREFGVYVRGSS